MIRLPNPKSDIQEYIRIIAIINNYTEESKENSFNFNNISKNLTKVGTISSQKTFGSKAIEASYRENKSLDSVFNQSKALSEVLRLLGFIVSIRNQHTFQVTQFGKFVASYFDTPRDDQKTEILKLVAYAFLNINFKHPQIISNEDINVKPFLATLQILPQIESFITRDEFNYFILTLGNDTEKALKDASTAILKARNEKDYFKTHKENILKDRGITKNTASNYTRIPISFFKSFNLLRKDNIKSFPNLKHYKTEKFIDGQRASNTTKIYVLDSKGKEVLALLSNSKNLKFKEIENTTKEERICYALLCLCHYYDISDSSVLNHIQTKLRIAIQESNNYFAFPYMLLKGEEVIEFETLLQEINDKFSLSLFNFTAKNLEIEYYIWNFEHSIRQTIQASLTNSPKINDVEFGCLNCRPAKCCAYTDEELTLQNEFLQEIPDKNADNVCPTSAITFDNQLFPQIDYSKCVDCGICISRCNYGAIYYENDRLVLKRDKSKQNFKTLKANVKGAQKEFSKLSFEIEYKIDNGQFVRILEKFHSKVMKLKKDEFYPLVRNLLRQIYLKAKVGKSGDTQWRYDAIVLEPFIMPVEIKSPTEDKSINPNAIRQAIENSITIEARHNLVKKAMSSVIAVMYSNKRSDAEDMLKDANELHNIKILLISVVVLSYLSLKNLENKFTVKDIEFLFKNTIGIFDTVAIKEFWLNFLARREELHAIDKKALYFSEKDKIQMLSFIFRQKLKTEFEVFEQIFDLVRAKK